MFLQLVPLARPQHSSTPEVNGSKDSCLPGGGWTELSQQPPRSGSAPTICLTRGGKGGQEEASAGKKACCVPPQPNQDLMLEEDGWDESADKQEQGWGRQVMPSPSDRRGKVQRVLPSTCSEMQKAEVEKTHRVIRDPVARSSPQLRAATGWTKDCARTTGPESNVGWVSLAHVLVFCPVWLLNVTTAGIPTTTCSAAFWRGLGVGSYPAMIVLERIEQRGFVGFFVAASLAKLHDCSRLKKFSALFGALYNFIKRPDP